MSDVLREITPEGVGIVTFNRPDTMNILSGEMLSGLSGAYKAFDSDDAVKVVLVTGSGRAFCAGADLNAGGGSFQADADEGSTTGFSSCPLSFQAWDVRKPVIAAVNGHAIGVGLGIALQADMRVFAEEGKYGFLQNRRGVVADFACERLLPQLIGTEKAFEMIVRGERLSGQQALAWGLAGRCVQSKDVLSTAMDIARDMAINCSPLVMAMHKRLLSKAPHMSLDSFIELETQSLHYSIAQRDAIEGGMAFAEKRTPQWTSSVTKDWPEFLD